MQNTKGLALEVRLSAYIDGEVNEAERKELEQLVARDDEARLVLEMLKAGNVFGNKAFEEFLHDPVPLSLVRQIKQGPGANPKAERVMTSAPRRVKVRLWPRALAASIALLLIGGSTGFIIGKTGNDGMAPTNVASARTWLDDIADYHRIYSRQTAEHLVEVPATDDRIESWLSASVGVNFALPNLTEKGLTFEGARLLVAAGKPVAQLMYQNEDGDIFAICFLKSKPGTADSKMTENMRDDIAMISWQKSGVSYVVVGPSADASLQQLAEAVSATI
ncbi:MAG TPA: anti-sigma factor [Pararhizobium sp.]|uniref:anti-sigma factor family protein n=1 Tax=Pararhizobium sp. TaxID=1977563 RepID=UPI002CBAF613|nr:anti-sigma factor [Pararhizobium sp.]HTO32708.1 anti-sigma factor [Pararhizobium sp.]